MKLNIFSNNSDDYFYKAWLLFKEAFGESFEAFVKVWEASNLNFSYFFKDENSQQIIAMCLNTTKYFELKDGVTVKTLSLSCVSVAKNHQKKGLSSQLLQAVVQKNETYFDYLFLQAWNYNYYKHLKFFDAQLNVDCEYVPSGNREAGVQILHHQDYINWLKLYKIFQADQKRKAAKWLLPLAAFTRLVRYKLLNNETLYQSKQSFCLVENQTITAYGFDNIQDFIGLLQNINHEKVFCQIPQTDLNELKTHNFAIEDKNNMLILQSNKGSAAEQDFCVWNYFI